MKKSILNEMMGCGSDLLEEIESSDINLRSFVPKNELNPKFFVNGKLNSRIRLRLLDIADDFIDTLGVKWVKHEDIYLTGSIANYTWSKYSDIDIHIVYDFDKVFGKKEFVREYFDMKKYSWSDEHGKLTIHGYPVELYVEDISDESDSTGVYSIERDEWLVEPEELDMSSLNVSFVKKVSSDVMNRIDSFEKQLKRTDDEHLLEVLRKKVRRLLRVLKDIRQKSLKKDDGELSNGNVIYKVIRRTGHLQKLYDLESSIYDKINSI